MIKNDFKELSPLEVIHQTANDLYDSGIIDGKTMRQYDELCLPPVTAPSADDIKQVRIKNKVSQTLFAKLLNVSISTVKQWELGKGHIMKKRSVLNKLVILILAISTSNVYAQAITTEEYSHLFKNYDGCFILYSVNKQKMISEYNPGNRCNQRIAPDSTFKIALSLMAFNEGIINQDTIFKWNNKKGILPTHDQDQTPLTWLKYSVVWVSQQITPQLGLNRIQRYLADFNYGNQDFSGDAGKNNGLQYAWLSSSLKISAIEQLNFLNAMLCDKLAINKKAVTNTRKNMYQGKLDNGADYYGKTGSGRHGHNEREVNPGQLRDGWFVGFIKKGSQQYIFVSNLTDKMNSNDKSDDNLKLYGSEILKPVTMKLLNNYFAK